MRRSTFTTVTTPTLDEIEKSCVWERMLKFVLLVNKQGQTRLSQYYEYVPVEERVTTEADIVRKCLARSEDSVNEIF